MIVMTKRLYAAYCIIGLCVLVLAKIDRKICSKSNGYFPKLGTLCRGYYKCKNFRPDELVCPEDQLFNTIIDQCVRKDRFLCLDKPRTGLCPTLNGYFLKPGTGCKSFYDCCNGEAKVKECPRDQLFDPSAKRCKWSYNYDCVESITNESSTDSPQQQSSTSSFTETETSKTKENTPSTTDENIVSSTLDSSETHDIFTSTKKSTVEEIVTESSTVETETMTTKSFTTPTRKLTTEATSESSTQEVASSTQGTSEFTTEIVSESSTEVSSSVPDTSEKPDTSGFTTEVIVSESPTEEVTIFTSETSEKPTEVVKESSTEFRTEVTVRESSTEVARLTPTTSELTTKEVSESPTEIESKFTSSTSELSTENIILSTLLTREPRPDEDASSTKTTQGFSTEETISSVSTFLSVGTNEETSNSLQTTVRTEMPWSTKFPVISTPVEIDIFCPEPNGYFPHPTNKHKFVACVNEVPSILTCPSDLVYKQNIHQCDYD